MRIWYPRTHASARPEKGDGSLFSTIIGFPLGKKTPVPFFKSLEGSTVVRFNVSPRCIHYLATRNDNYVYSCQYFMASKQLSNQPFRPIPSHGITDLLAGRYAKTRRTEFIWQGETGHETAAKPSAALVDPGKFRAPPQLVVEHANDRRLGQTREPVRGPTPP